MESTKEKVSYCIGLETGKNLKKQFVEIDFKLLLEGFQDAIQEKTPKLPAEEVKAVLEALRKQVEVQQKEYMDRFAQENKQAGEAFLTENKKKENVQTTASGLQYKIIEMGEGPKPKLLDTVKVHYKGRFIDGEEFDSSYKRGEPTIFPVNRVIPGWSEALQLMKVGAKWQLFVPSYLAYGEMGFGNAIGPNTTLLFELELIGIE